MGAKFRVKKEMISTFESLTYSEKVRLLVAFSILEKRGISSSVIERWGKGKHKSEFLLIPVSKPYKEGEQNGQIPEEIIHSVKIDLSRI